MKIKDEIIDRACRVISQEQATCGGICPDPKRFEDYVRTAARVFEAALPAAEPVPVAYRHTLHMDLGQTDVEVNTCEKHPFGRPDVDYSPEYRITTEPLYAASPATSVAVKALEWDEFSTELKRHFQSNTILGQYQIAYLGEFECWQLYSPQKSSTWKENFSRHKSSDEAKAAAQADYEARIRSALA